MKINSIFAILASLLMLTTGLLADEIAKEDFDGGDVNLTSTTNVHAYPGLGGDFGDVFGVVTPAHTGGDGMTRAVADDTVSDVSGFGVNPTDPAGVAGGLTGSFFAMDDMDGLSVPGFTFATWSFDISSAVGGLTDIQIELGAMGDFETSTIDGLRIEAQIDGAGYQTIFLARADESDTKTYRPLDGGLVQTFNDPLQLFIDGSLTATGTLDKTDPLTGRFDTYTSTLMAGQTGSTLDIRVSWEGSPGSSEPMAVDNITINGVAAAGPVLPDSFAVSTGSVDSGGLPELLQSDNQYLVMDPAFTMFRYELVYTVDATSSTDTPSALEFNYESKTFNVIGTVDQKIELFNYDSGQFETVDSRLTTPGDSVVTVTPGGDATRFVQNGTGAMRARISYQNSPSFWVFMFSALFLPYETSADQVFWTISP